MRGLRPSDTKPTSHAFSRPDVVGNVLPSDSVKLLNIFSEYGVPDLGDEAVVGLVASLLQTASEDAPSGTLAHNIHRGVCSTVLPKLSLAQLQRLALVVPAVASQTPYVQALLVALGPASRVALDKSAEARAGYIAAVERVLEGLSGEFRDALSTLAFHKV